MNPATAQSADSILRLFSLIVEGRSGRPPLIQLLEVVGSNTEQFLCPCCGSHDRKRHLLMYLAQLIELQQPEIYIQADMYPQSDRIEEIDMHSIPYPDASFTVVIANHVLEHVDDDQQAMSEIRRVLNLGGLTIL